MPDERLQLLRQILDALFEAEFCQPNEKAQREQKYIALLEQASQMSGKSVGLIKEAILKSRYPQFRAKRLAEELRNTPSPSRTN